ncbi:hypothetical protein OPV22_022225 [Ensete ventricosum]|uniref:Myb-like domain-containing protein n=1 Tax=Ensete ventricosum TaxID=4639 RepID=A0AAV8QU20_ENSVE|nr:hypothetical protein OPV22_022225 [Ensete ventricosum]
MADLDRSSDDVSMDSKDGSSRDSKMDFSEDEDKLISRMYNLVGERWSLIAGRIPGRTAEEIESSFGWFSLYLKGKSNVYATPFAQQNFHSVVLCDNANLQADCVFSAALF